MQLHITIYEFGNIHNHAAERPRKLLMHKNQLKTWQDRMGQKGIAAIPLLIYIKGRKIKIQIAMVKGKKLYDKRETAKKRDAQREIERAMKGQIDR